jgi:hypothetical protein
MAREYSAEKLTTIEDYLIIETSLTGELAT